MRRQRLSAVTTLGVVAVLGAASLSGSTGEGGSPEQFIATGSSNNNADPSCKGKNNATCIDNPNGGGPVKSMGVSVTAPGLLYPTISRDVTVAVSNPQAFDIVVERLDIAVDAPSGAGCSAQDLMRPASPLSTNLVVPAKQVATTKFPVSLDADVPSGCQQGIWNLTVTATAVKR